MRYPKLVIAAMVASILPQAAAAQRVVADVRIGSGPVAGHIIVGDPYDHYPRYHARPVYREVIVYPVHRGHGWWRNRSYRAVRVWYDSDYDRYYDRDSQYRDGLREVVIYERDGRYYGDELDRHVRGDRDDRDRYYDRDAHERDRGRDNRYRNQDRD